jgi:uncharacterized protein YlxP (DUF503 family)
MEMTVYLPASFSLKDKRKTLNSLLDQIRNNFNASAAEVEHQDRHRLSTISVAVTNSSRNRIDQVFDEILDLVDAEPTLQTREFDRTIV